VRPSGNRCRVGGGKETILSFLGKTGNGGWKREYKRPPDKKVKKGRDWKAEGKKVCASLFRTLRRRSPIFNT